MGVATASHHHRQTVQSLKSEKRSDQEQNSPITVLAISVRCCRSGLTGGELLDAVTQGEGTAVKALSQQRRGLPVRLLVCYKLRQVSGR